MDIKKKEIREDLAEIQKLANECKRSAVKDYLMGYCIQLEEELKSFPQETSASVIESLPWKPITTFGWDQDLTVVKIYVTSIGNLKNHPQEKVKLEHTKNFVMVSIFDFNGQNLRLKFPKLQYNISSATISLRSSGFNLTLIKETQGFWEVIEYDEEVQKKIDAKNAPSGNPSDLLVSMMKDMYLNGDDEEVKRTIYNAFNKNT